MKLDVEVYLNTKYPESNIKANANVTFDDAFVVKGFKVMNSDEKGLFVGMPSVGTQKDGKMEYTKTANPITKEFREQLNNAVMKEYEKALEKHQNMDNTQEAAQSEPPDMGAEM